MSGLIKATKNSTNKERLFMQKQCMQDMQGQHIYKNKHASMANTKK